jgi:hypothetical protein
MVSADGLRAGMMGALLTPTFFCPFPPPTSCPPQLSLRLLPARPSPHLVTSSILLPRLLLKDEASSPSSAFNPGGALPFANHLLLLQTYLSMATTWKIIHGDHALPIVDSYAATDAQMFSPVRAGPGALPSPVIPWVRSITSGLQSPDEHTPKLVRALSDFVVRWDTRAVRYYSTGRNDSGTGGCWQPLEGIERLDGTLFDCAHRWNHDRATRLGTRGREGDSISASSSRAAPDTTMLKVLFVLTSGCLG